MLLLVRHLSLLIVWGRILDNSRMHICRKQERNIKERYPLYSFKLDRANMVMLRNSISQTAFILEHFFIISIPTFGLGHVKVASRGLLSFLTFLSLVPLT